MQIPQLLTDFAGSIPFIRDVPLSRHNNNHQDNVMGEGHERWILSVGRESIPMNAAHSWLLAERQRVSRSHALFIATRENQDGMFTFQVEQVGSNPVFVSQVEDGIGTYTALGRGKKVTLTIGQAVFLVAAKYDESGAVANPNTSPIGHRFMCMVSTTHISPQTDTDSSIPTRSTYEMPTSPVRDRQHNEQNSSTTTSSSTSGHLIPHRSTPQSTRDSSPMLAQSSSSSESLISPPITINSHLGALTGSAKRRRKPFHINVKGDTEEGRGEGDNTFGRSEERKLATPIGDLDEAEEDDKEGDNRRHNGGVEGGDDGSSSGWQGLISDRELNARQKVFFAKWVIAERQRQALETQIQAPP